jgi:methylmalonyl-CoA mutase, N-terminal domain
MAETTKKEFRTLDNVPLKRVYTAADVAQRRTEDQIGMPGEFPFTRGIHPEMYRQNPWIMGMYSGAGTAEETNKRFHYLLSRGQTGFSIALDLPTQMGYDPDDPMAVSPLWRIWSACSRAFRSRKSARSAPPPTPSARCSRRW